MWTLREEEKRVNTEKMVVGNVHVVEALTHEQALAKSPDDGIHIFYRFHGVLYRLHRLGKEYVIINHVTNGYYLSDGIRKGMEKLGSNTTWEVLGILIKNKQILRGFMEHCILADRYSVDDYDSRIYMENLYNVLKRHY